MNSILVVDDNPTNLRLASRILESVGFSVQKAAHAFEALDCIKNKPPSLILMDIAMPDMDGLTLTRQLKADPLTNRIPIIALTAYAMKGDEEKAKQAGCDGYLTKPIDKDLLRKKVKEMIGMMEAN